MIRAAFFDLDGTLVQTERLKAQAYAQAAQEVLGLDAPDLRAVDAYREAVGSSREVASRHVMARLGLEAVLTPLMEANGASEPAEVLTKLRLRIYNAMVSDAQLLWEHRWPHALGLLHLWGEEGCATGVATMSMRREALWVLDTLGVTHLLDFVLTREDVTKPKPDPEIYLKAASQAEVPPSDCLVIEDSSPGVQAALAAGMHVVAAATPFTESGLRGAPGLDPRWIVRDPELLIQTVQELMAEQGAQTHPLHEP